MRRIWKSLVNAVVVCGDFVRRICRALFNAAVVRFALWMDSQAREMLKYYRTWLFLPNWLLGEILLRITLIGVIILIVGLIIFEWIPELLAHILML